MSELLTEAEFWSKIDYEGDIASAIEYGLKPESCEPGALRDAYQEVWDRMRHPKLVAAIAQLEGELARVEAGMGW